ncbi:transglutaminase-like putative cysteine protease [Rhizomicrobium palustre]|uniref:Transglutaminase-like putative cysteine protease n=1 Tax=Rhizomicrobium palustre TaxID=189966 RepID=A0A846MWZ7_9PROT|nr:transglutaminase family protein [Rhizomicrobium palustre]NIK88078.1 transglutaminase-like putative cysteine protease [Rhizomicrobium palustre]
MFYSIRHITRFRYLAPVRESVMEIRMQPRSEGPQALRSFQINTNPRAQLYAYTDHFGNAVYHFNVLRAHEELRIESQAVVELTRRTSLPEAADMLEWSRFNGYNLNHDHFDLLEPSKFTETSALLTSFIQENGLSKPEGDPLTALKKLNATINEAFDYESGITEVNSLIDHALTEKRGVCQDFTHIMIAIARSWGIPTRYVSGYLYHRPQAKDRSGADATHAWLECYLPSLGWVGFDPTNNVVAAERHIRAAVGRDYADVPPTRGTYKGPLEHELATAVSVEPTQAPVRHEDFLRVARPMSSPPPTPSMPERLYHQQQQQQQQQ